MQGGGLVLTVNDRFPVYTRPGTDFKYEFTKRGETTLSGHSVGFIGNLGKSIQPEYYSSSTNSWLGTYSRHFKSYIHFLSFVLKDSFS